MLFLQCKILHLKILLTFTEIKTSQLKYRVTRIVIKKKTLLLN